VEFVVAKESLAQVFSGYFGFRCQFSFHRLLHTHHLSSGAGTIGELVADVPSGLSLTPPQETKKILHLLSGYAGPQTKNGSQRNGLGGGDVGWIHLAQDGDQ
jgi:hypothetical protein